MPLEYGAGYHWSNVLEKGKKDLEVLALRNTSTTTPDKVVRSVNMEKIRLEQFGLKGKPNPTKMLTCEQTHP